MEKKKYLKEITTLLDGAVEEKTFSLEAVKKIKQLKDDYEVLAEKYEKALEDAKVEAKNMDELVQQFKQLEGEFEKVQKELAEMKSFREKLEEREREVRFKEQEASYQRNRADELKEVFGIIFKNTIVRENVQKTIPVKRKDPYTQEKETVEQVNVQDNKTTSKEVDPNQSNSQQC